MLEKGTSVFKNFHKLDGSLRAAFQLGLIYLPGFLSIKKNNPKSWLPRRDSDFKGIKQTDEYHSANSSSRPQWKRHCFRCYCQRGSTALTAVSENRRLELAYIRPLSFDFMSIQLHYNPIFWQKQVISSFSSNVQ